MVLIQKEIDEMLQFFADFPDGQRAGGRFVCPTRVCWLGEKDKKQIPLRE
jgi:hypothetical protein